MKTPDRMRLALAALLLATAGQAAAADYVQAPGSTLVFASNYQGETFTGRFGSFTTTMRFDPKQLATSQLDVAIQLAGTQTGNKDRDDTLVSADFFNVGKFAQARYTATKFRALGGNQYAADGTLTLRGVSKPVVLNAVLNKRGLQPMLGKQAIGFDATAAIKRSDFGISKHVPMVGDVVTLRITAEAHAK